MSNRVAGTLSADGSSAIITTRGGPVFISGTGTFGTGTLTLEYRLENNTFVAVDATIVCTLTAAGSLLSADFPPAITLRLTLSGATAPSLNYILAA